MSSYPLTLDYLFSLHRFGIKLGLEVITGLLQRLGNPQHSFATLHIGGTNGKGSSAAMAAAILRSAGYRVGLYTSPHLVDFRERIQVQGAMIGPDQVCDLTDRLRTVSDPDGSVTFFEFTTAMAFQYFADQAVDIGVIEVGMGGRFDATNVLDPLGVLITTVAFDHEMYLGNTLDAIAREKAGILKPGIPAVLGPMPPEASQVIRESADSLHAPRMTYGEDFRVTQEADGGFGYQGPDWEWHGLRTNLLGRHQVINAANALALLEIAARSQFPLTESAIRMGLQHVIWPGRLEILGHDPLIIVDGAHNPSAGSVLFDFLESQLHDAPDRKLIMVIGMMADKHHGGFLRLFQRLADYLIFTQPHMARAASPETLAAALEVGGQPPLFISNPKEALDRARSLACPADLICVTGSLFLVGEIAEHCFSSGFPIAQV